MIINFPSDLSQIQNLTLLQSVICNKIAYLITFIPEALINVIIYKLHIYLKLWPCTFFTASAGINYEKVSIMHFLSGVLDFFDRNKILSGGDLSQYQVPHWIRVFFYFVWFAFIHHNFQFYFFFNYVPIVTFWIFTYHKIWICWLSSVLYEIIDLFFNMFGSVLECCELTGVSLLWPWLIKWK